MDINSSINLLRKLFESNLGICPDNDQVDKLLRFYNMVIEKNKVMNLTAITDFEEFVIKHYIDSLEIIRVIELSGKEYNLIDIGTGAGFPGIPLKILYPDLHITLFDSQQKRLSFLDEVIAELKLDKIVTLHGRAEEFGRKLDYREKYDIVVSRAVAGLNSLCEISVPFCKVGGYFIAYKGFKGSDELQGAQRCIDELGCKIEKNEKYNLDVLGVDNDRYLIKLHKLRATKSKYPRGGGKPFKTPLYIDTTTK